VAQRNSPLQVQAPGARMRVKAIRSGSDEDGIRKMEEEEEAAWEWAGRAEACQAQHGVLAKISAALGHDDHLERGQN